MPREKRGQCRVLTLFVSTGNTPRCPGPKGLREPVLTENAHEGLWWQSPRRGKDPSGTGTRAEPRWHTHPAGHSVTSTRRQHQRAPCQAPRRVPLPQTSVEREPAQLRAAGPAQRAAGGSAFSPRRVFQQDCSSPPREGPDAAGAAGARPQHVQGLPQSTSKQPGGVKRAAYTFPPNAEESSHLQSF